MKHYLKNIEDFCLKEFLIKIYNVVQPILEGLI